MPDFEPHDKADAGSGVPSSVHAPLQPEIVSRERETTSRSHCPDPSSTSKQASVYRRPNIVAVVCDALQAPVLGAYGSTWVETPALDEWASQSFVFDQFRADALHLDDLYRGYWTGCSSLAPLKFAGRQLPLELADAGYHTHLVTDDAVVADWAELFQTADLYLAEDFATAENVLDTHIAKMLAVASAAVDRFPSPFFLWIHLQGMSGPWDAPYEMRLEFAEDDDPDPPRELIPPREYLKKDVDPDFPLGWRMAYMAQVKALDQAWADVSGHLLNPERGPYVSLFAAPRGYRLGLHHLLGDVGDAMYDECLHTPLWISDSYNTWGLARSSALAQPGDLYYTLRDAAVLPAPSYTDGLQHGKAPCFSLLPLMRGEKETVRESVCGISGRERSIHTAAWHLRFLKDKAQGDGTSELSSSEDAPSRELFVKPDDRFEVNDVLRISVDVADKLEEAWNKQKEALELPRYHGPPPLEERLKIVDRG